MLKNIVKKVLREHMLDPDKLSRFKKRFVDTADRWSDTPEIRNGLVIDIHKEYGYVEGVDYYFYRIPGYNEFDIRLFKKP
jgi:plasmid stabilization system protein ParE